MTQFANKDNKGNPYHDEEGKFTSGNNASKKEETYEDKLAKMGFGPNKPQKNEFIVEYAGHDPEGGDDFEIELSENQALDYILTGAYNNKFANYDKEFQDWYDSVDLDWSKFDSYDKLKEMFKQSPFYNKIGSYFNDVVAEDDELRDKIQEDERERYEAAMEGDY